MNRCKPGISPPRGSGLEEFVFGIRGHPGSGAVGWCRCQYCIFFESVLVKKGRRFRRPKTSVKKWSQEDESDLSVIFLTPYC